MLSFLRNNSFSTGDLKYSSLNRLRPLDQKIMNCICGYPTVVNGGGKYRAEVSDHTSCWLVGQS